MKMKMKSIGYRLQALPYKNINNSPLKNVLYKN